MLAAKLRESMPNDGVAADQRPYPGFAPDGKHDKIAQGCDDRVHVFFTSLWRCTGIQNRRAAGFACVRFTRSWVLATHVGSALRPVEPMLDLAPEAPETVGIAPKVSVRYTRICGTHTTALLSSCLMASF